MLGTTEARKQHYVPKMLLKHFVRDDGRIGFRNTQTGSFKYAASTTAVAYSGGYFDVLRVANLALSAENWLQEIELRASTVVDRIVVDPRELLSPSAREEMDLARFLASLRFRSPTFRAEFEAQRTQLIEWGREMATAWARSKRIPEKQLNDWLAGEDAFLPEDLQIPASAAVAEHLGETEDYAHLLTTMDWRIGRAAAEMFTTDNPVAGAYLRRVADGLGGFDDLVYYVPLSREVVLRFSPRS